MDRTGKIILYEITLALEDNVKCSLSHVDSSFHSVDPWI